MAKKKKTNSFSPMDITKNVVSSGMIAGVGATTLGAMGQGAVAGAIIPPMASGIGMYGTAGMGMGVLDMVSNMTKKKKKQ